ncbi:Eco57I restriction-modification methylase domain-containing protein [Planctomycetota bacterium]
MEANHKKILKAISLELRHLLEGYYDPDGKWQPGDLEQRLAAIGVRRDRAPVPVDELAHLSDDDKHARTVVDAYLQLRDEADVSREEAVAEFVRETAYTWANRLLCLRCMEARELIDEVILQKEAYGGRSLEHHRLAQRDPEVCSGEDDGLFAMLEKVFTDQTEHLPLLFDPQSPGVALKPSPAVLKQCLALLSGTESVRSQDPATGEVFQAPDALGWAYQYWNTEEKDRVFETVRTKKGAKIAGADIIPATQLYTEPYMVKFLVQNSLGATWMGMYPNSKLCEKWEYYVRDADRSPVEKKAVAEITFLDPACGSGHFLIEAFDLYYDMYVEEGELTEAEDICGSILEKNLFGIDIDARAVQIAEAALWMKAAERAFDFQRAATNLVAAVASHLKGDLWEEFLAGFEREPSVARVLRKFGQAMEHIDELGSLARPSEELRAIIRKEHTSWERQVREQKEANFLFPELVTDALSGHLPFQEISDEEFGDRLFYRARSAINAFKDKAKDQRLFRDQLIGHETAEGFRLFAILDQRFAVVATNPPYMGFKTMGPHLKKFIDLNYAAGKRDLYAAFILRCHQLAAEGGRTAMVTRKVWFALRTFLSLREQMLEESRFEAVADLGPRAFNPDAQLHDGVTVALFVIVSTPPAAGDRITCLRHDATLGPEAKADVLHCSSARLDHVDRYSVEQERLKLIPESPLIYWLTPGLLELLSLPMQRRLGNHCDIVLGVRTSNDPRFVRYFWETPESPRWFDYEKGGGHCRWTGLHRKTVDWQYEGARLANYICEKFTYLKGNPGILIRGVNDWCSCTLTYTDVAAGSFCCRHTTRPSIPSDDGPGIAVKSEPGVVHAFLNSRLASYLMRILSPNPLHFGKGYVELLPMPDDRMPPLLSSLVQVAVLLKENVLSRCPIEAEFVYHIRHALPRSEVVSSADAWLATVEGLLEEEVFRGWRISDSDKEHVIQDTGTPPAWFPLISGYDQTPPVPAGMATILADVEACLRSRDREVLLPQDLAHLKDRLLSLFEIGPGAKLEGEDVTNETDDNDHDDAKTSGTPIPSVTYLEELATELHVHPVSVYWLVREGVEAGTCRCLPEERQLLAKEVEMAAVRLLGHRWPKQIEAGDPAAEWVDPDGIIPLTEGTDESTLLERVRERISADFKDGDVASIEREFAEIMGKPLEKWLTMEFFKHHTKQFKKRPIAWQIQSSKFTARKKPAFACLAYYHKLDGDLLPKIRNQYVGPLRSRLETELRSIKNVSTDARSDRQEGRRGELEDQIDELRDFDATLQKVITEGFASKELAKIVKDEPLDRWSSLDGTRPEPESQEALLQQESRYFPDINDGVRVNIAPLQKAGLLAADVLAKKDLDKAIADRAQWRADDRRWCREQKLPQPGWWPEQ